MSTWEVCFESTTTYLMPGGHWGFSGANEGMPAVRRDLSLVRISGGGREPKPVPSREALAAEAESILRERDSQRGAARNIPAVLVPAGGLDASALIKAFRTNGAQAVIDVFTKSLGRATKAAGMAESSTASPKPRADLMQRRAIAYMALGAPGLALSDVQGALFLHPSNLPAVLLGTRIYTMFGRYGEAMGLLDGAMKAMHSDMEAAGQGGDTAAGRKLRGLAVLQKKLVKYETVVVEMESLSKSRLRTVPHTIEQRGGGKEEAARRRHATMGGGGEAPFLSAAGPILGGISVREAVHGMSGTTLQLQTARHKADLLLLISPNSAALAQFRARASLALGEEERAAADAATAIKVGDNGDAPYALAILATALHNMGESGRVIGVIKECFRLDPENKGHCRAIKNYIKRLGISIQTGDASAKRGDGDDAVGAYRTGLGLAPPRKTQQQLWGAICRVSLKMLQGRGGIEACSALLGFEPQNPEFLMLRGKAHEMSGDMARAVLDYEQVIAMYY